MSNKPTPTQSNSPTQKEHIVAYLEIMDCENKMQNPQDSDLLLAQLAWIYNDVMKWPGRVKAGGHPDIEVKIFSNNVVIAMEEGDNDQYPTNCYSVAKFCIGFQTMALTYGLFLHGAVTVGKFASGKLQPEEKDNQSFFVYGEALVKAYSLTNENTTLPCVIIDNCIFKNASPEELLRNETLAEMYLRREDGKYFLNPFRILKSLKKDFQDRSLNILQEIREMLLSEYAKTLIDKSISSEKHYFSLTLFNRFCIKHKEYEHLQIPVEIFDRPCVTPNKPRAELKTILDKRPPQSFVPPQQAEYIVAHLDFLGAAKKMRVTGESDKFLWQIDTIYSAALEMKKRLAKLGLNKIETKIFSDNIIIAKKTNNPQCSISEFIEVQTFCRMFQTYALIFGAIVRGAITQGKFFMDNTFAYGEALCKAYNLEAKAAVYPRIIVDPAMFSGIKIDDLNLEGLKRDQDGLYFLDNFDFLEKHFSDKEFPVVFEKTRATIIAEYKKILNLQKLDLIAKYHWLANQFNEYCYANNHPFSINLDKLTLEGVK